MNILLYLGSSFCIVIKNNNLKMGKTGGAHCYPYYMFPSGSIKLEHSCYLNRYGVTQVINVEGGTIILTIEIGEKTYLGTQEIVHLSLH